MAVAVVAQPRDAVVGGDAAVDGHQGAGRRLQVEQAHGRTRRSESTSTGWTSAAPAAGYAGPARHQLRGDPLCLLVYGGRTICRQRRLAGQRVGACSSVLREEHKVPCPYPWLAHVVS